MLIGLLCLSGLDKILYIYFRSFLPRFTYYLCHDKRFLCCVSFITSSTQFLRIVMLLCAKNIETILVFIYLFIFRMLRSALCADTQKLQNLLCQQVVVPSGA